MNEKEIRPDKLEKKCAVLFEKDLKKFFKNDRNFIKVNCPACDSVKYKKEFKKNIFKFCRCSKCDTLFINPRPTSEQLSEFYTNGQAVSFWSNYVFPATEKIRIKNIFIPRAQLIAKLLRKHHVKYINSAVDVGAGYGTFLDVARRLKLAKKFIAIEPAGESAKKCEERGFEVIKNMVEDINIEDRFDLVVNFELIEHLFDPKLFVQHCGKLLRKDGIFIVTTPNIAGFDLSVLGIISDNISGPTHLNYFNLSSLSHLLEKNGFEVLETLTPGELDVDIVKNKMNSGKFDDNKLPFFAKLIKRNQDNFNEKLQKLLQDNKLSSNMMIIARKK